MAHEEQEGGRRKTLPTERDWVLGAVRQHCSEIRKRFSRG